MAKREQMRTLATYTGQFSEKMDVELFIRTGEMKKYRPPPLRPELQSAVDKHVALIRKAGRFVMPPTTESN